MKKLWLTVICMFSFRMPSHVRSSIIIFWIFCAVFSNCNSSATCQIKPCTVKQYHFSRERDSVENYALCGYSFKNLTVTSHKSCFEQCAWNCRCISFNYLITASKDNCQLNEENKHLKPGALKRRDGRSYHELRIDYNVKVREAKTFIYIYAATSLTLITRFLPKRLLVSITKSCRSVLPRRC